MQMSCSAPQRIANRAGKIHARCNRSFRSFPLSRSVGRTCVSTRVQSSPQQSGELDLSAPALLASVPFLFALPAFSEEAATVVAAASEAAPEAEAAATATNQSFIGPVEILVLLSPILIYVLFNIYRQKYNPRATFVDFTLIFASFVVVGNLFSIAVFHQRLF